LDHYITFNNIKNNKLFPGYSINRKRLNELVVEGKLRTFTNNKGQYYFIEDIKTYIKTIDQFNSEFISIQEFFTSIIPSRKPYQQYMNKFMKILEGLDIEIYSFDNMPPTQRTKFVRRIESNKFNSKYISFLDLFSEQNLHSYPTEFFRMLKENNIEILQIFARHEYTFVSRREYEVFRSKSDDITLKNTKEYLDINNSTNFNNVLIEYNIKSYRGKYKRHYINKDDFDFLSKKQKSVLTYLSNNYYDLDELENLFESYGRSKVPGEKIASFNKIDIPFIARVSKYKNKNKLYSKKEVEKFLLKIEKENLISDILSVTSTNYMDLLNSILLIDGYIRDENETITMKFWFIHIHKTIQSSSASHITKVRRISKFAKVTLLLKNAVGNKEIYNLSNKELELCLFNRKINITYRQEIYQYLRNLNQVLLEKKEQLIDLSNFTNIRQKKVGEESEIYDVEVYLKLCNFIADSEQHRKKNIEILQQYLNNGNSPYINYSSYWLYIILHLNNAIRHQDVLEFPRSEVSSLNFFNIRSFDDLKDLIITDKDAAAIVKIYQLHWYTHNKNKEQSPFYCSHLLTKSFAYAIVFCEFIQETKKIYNTNKLIDFNSKSNNPNTVIKKYFFKNFKINRFTFKSRKMNRTLITLISTIINTDNQLDSIHIARHLRGHVNIETTNIYINIPQNHFDLVMSQVFDKGSFGYVYDLIYKKYYEFENNDKGSSKHELVRGIKQVFGSVSKLEELTKKFTYLYNRRKEAEDYVSSLTQDEVYEKFRTISLGLSPAKEVNFQCLFNSCISLKVNCNKCPFSIPNWYELITIGKRLRLNMLKYDEIIKNEFTPWGELQKIYNFIILDIAYILEAHKKFGEEIIDLILADDFEIIKERLLSLPDPLNLRKLESYDQ
jgi:hypothetical protein